MVVWDELLKFYKKSAIDLLQSMAAKNNTSKKLPTALVEAFGEPIPLS